MKKIRVLVVEDSLTVRMRLVNALTSDPEIEVVGQASDGKRALELCQSLRPDVVTLDIVLPIMSGLAAAEYIMAYCPTPILVVSASKNRGAIFKSFEALSAGAVDVLEKPNLDDPDDEWDPEFLRSVKQVSRIKVISHLKGKLGRPQPDPRLPTPTPPNPTPANHHRLIVMGASTGGPAAVCDLLRALPRDFPLPILLVIHIGQMFGAGLLEWLRGESPIPVVSAEDGVPLPQRGTPRVVLAPPDRHVVLQNGRIRLNSDPERHSCRPSVDVLFESVAREQALGTVGCLLTGMGKDGAQGLLALRRAGALTLAQDEATSTVYGMPREAALLGAATHIIPLGDFAPMLRGLASSGVVRP